MHTIAVARQEMTKPLADVASLSQDRPPAVDRQQHVAAGQHSLIATRLVVTWACISLSAQGPDQVEAFPPQARVAEKLEPPTACCTLTLFTTMICSTEALVWNDRGTSSALEGGVSKPPGDAR